MNKVNLILRIIVSIIYLQTLFFKFSGAEESVYIFSTLGLEPWGRYGSGFAELVISVLILVPSTVWLGAVGSIGVIGGALLSHVFFLGIEVRGDGGMLFYMALAVFILSVYIAFTRKDEIIGNINSVLKR